MTTQLTADDHNAQFLIRKISSEGLIVNQTTYRQGAILCHDRHERWDWQDSPTFSEKTLVWRDLPSWAQLRDWEVVLVGLQMPHRVRQRWLPFQAECAQKKIGFELMSLEGAVSTFNILASDRRSVLALMWWG